MDERRLFELSEMQHNLVSRAQARRLGVDRAAIARRVRRGDWIEVSSRVLRRAGAAADVEEPIMATVLHHGRTPWHPCARRRGSGASRGTSPATST
jgi:hypothetical protein